MAREDELIIEGAKVIFRNFSGVGNEWNREGERNFCIVLEPNLAAELEQAGWNVKPLTDRDNPDDVIYILKKIHVNLDSKWPPKMFTVAPNGTLTRLDAQGVSDLDQAYIKHVDLKLNPHYWERNGNSGISAYVKEAYFVLEEDYLASKYAQQESPREDDVIHPEEMPFN